MDPGCLHTPAASTPDVQPAYPLLPGPGSPGGGRGVGTGWGDIQEEQREAGEGGADEAIGEVEEEMGGDEVHAAAFAATASAVRGGRRGVDVPEQVKAVLLGGLRVRMGIATGVLEPGGGISNSEVLARAKGGWAGSMEGGSMTHAVRGGNTHVLHDSCRQGGVYPCAP